MKPIQTIFISACMAASLGAADAIAKTVEATSPSGLLSIVVDDTESLSFSLSADGKPLLNRSQISLQTQHRVEDASQKYPKIKSSSLKKGLKEKISAPFHHTPDFDAEWNELNVRLSNGQTVTFRLFDDGVAYRFSTDNKEDQTIYSEVATYCLAGDPALY
ncbi:MAG: glycoside hydrolase family 97 N-terminal domain-containing protein, partial [Muribaculaceae bacterium]|nr:glycoside hydrolase family 97 N-terminal domain-containing protein [Muribaculaceae bacterium]